MSLSAPISDGVGTHTTPPHEPTTQLRRSGSLANTHNTTPDEPGTSKRVRLTTPIQWLDVNATQNLGSCSQGNMSPKLPPTPRSEQKNAREEAVRPTESSSNNTHSPFPTSINILEGIKSGCLTPVSAKAETAPAPEIDGWQRKRRYHSPEGPGGGRSSCLLETNNGPKAQHTQAATASLREEQKHIQVIASYPGKVALISDTWYNQFGNFQMPDGVFFKKTSIGETKWPRIYERKEGQAFRGAKELCAIMGAMSHIGDIRRDYLAAKTDAHKDHTRKIRVANHFRARYVKEASKVVNSAIKWAWHDGDLDKSQKEYPPVVTVFEVKRLDTQADAAKDIHNHMGALVGQWRETMEKYERMKYGVEATDEFEQSKAETLGRPQAPVVYGFAIMEHNILLIHQDASDSNSAPFVQINLDMDTDNQRQWYAMMIMVTICYARDRLKSLTGMLGFRGDEVNEEGSDDPDR